MHTLLDRSARGLGLEAAHVSTLLIDNYDSYTYNVFHLLAAVSGEEPIVVHNDIVSWRALSRWDFDAIVLSPGPGRPERWHDFGVCSDILRSSEVPVLGVCLGHQGLGHVLDGDGRERADRHARTPERASSTTAAGLFAGIPQDFSVVRYHSLAVAGALGPEGRVTAWTDDGVVMGIEHRSRPLWGVQFHPESIATEHGRRLCRELLRARAPPPRRARARLARTPRTPPGGPHRAGHVAQRRRGSSCAVRSLAGEPSTELLFERLFGGPSTPSGWTAPTRRRRWRSARSSARALGADRCVIEYDVRGESRDLTPREAARPSSSAAIFDVLDRELATHAIEPAAGLPRGLLGGFVGYLGYECKADCGSPNVHRSDVPDAVLMLANRVVAVDHVAHRTHLAALCREGRRGRRALAGGTEAIVRDALAQQAATIAAAAGAAADGEDGARTDPVYVPLRARTRAVPRRHRPLPGGAARGRVLRGVPDRPDPRPTRAPSRSRCIALLRRRNPAPFAAYLKLGELAVVSSSPERFIGIDRDRQRAGAADQGHGAALAGPAARRAAARRAAARREDVRRAPDDRGSAAQRPRARVRGGQRCACRSSWSSSRTRRCTS